MNRLLLGYSPDFDVFDEAPVIRRSIVPSRAATSEPVFDRATTMMLAAELLESDNEAELGDRIHDLIRRAGAAVGHLVSPPTTSVLERLLHRAARVSMPALGMAPSAVIAARAGAGITITDPLPNGAFFGIELEGLSPEDQEFEAAKAYVRFAGDAARRAALTRLRLPPASIARLATVRAAHRHAPGWLQLVAQQRHASRANSTEHRSARIDPRRSVGVT